MAARRLRLAIALQRTAAASNCVQPRVAGLEARARFSAGLLGYQRRPDTLDVVCAVPAALPSSPLGAYVERGALRLTSATGFPREDHQVGLQATGLVSYATRFRQVVAERRLMAAAYPPPGRRSVYAGVRAISNRRTSPADQSHASSNLCRRAQAVGSGPRNRRPRTRIDKPGVVMPGGCRPGAAVRGVADQRVLTRQG